MIQSVMRTGVPIVYAILIKLGLGGLGLGDEVNTDIATVILTVAIYGFLRAVEQLWPKVGVLLGWIGAPSYGDVVKGEVVKSETLTKGELESALADLRDDFSDLVESKVTASVGAAVGRELNAVTKKAVATAKKAPAKKAAPK